MRELALHQITMMTGGPTGLVRFAAGADIRKVCLFTASPKTDDGGDMFPTIDKKNEKAFEKLLADTGISLMNAEYFPIMPSEDVGQYAASLERAAALGAKRAVTHIHEENPARITEQLHKLCSMGQILGLEIGLEFTGFSAGCDNLQKAVALQDEIDRHNLKLGVDALHFFRTGGSLDHLQTLDPARIGYAQICDGLHLTRTNDYLDEAMNRSLPGEGVFPLKEFVTLFGDHVDFDIEVPRFGKSPDNDAKQWAEQAILTSQKLFEPLENSDDT